jgi:hypothetical protein
MGITVAGPKIHWNYFLALERDMEAVARYVEFDEANFSTYSIELGQLLFAAASEVDVIAKLLCEYINPLASRNNIRDYKAVLRPAMPNLPDAEVFLPRYGLSFNPWQNWRGTQNPQWWRAYNKVKHERNTHFNQATLKNALNSLGGLLIFTHEYYARRLAQDPQAPLPPKDAMQELQPASSLLRLREDFYYGRLLV